METKDLVESMDAAVWAKEFVRINGGDEDVMRGWFANTIMAGYDHGVRKGKCDTDGL